MTDPAKEHLESTFEQQRTLAGLFDGSVVPVHRARLAELERVWDRVQALNAGATTIILTAELRRLYQMARALILGDATSAAVNEPSLERDGFVAFDEDGTGHWTDAARAFLARMRAETETK